MAKIKSRKARIFAAIVASLGLIASVIGIFGFVTGRNLPDWFPHPEDHPSAPPAKVPSALQPTTLPSSQTIRSIMLPDTVLGFTSFDNASRQSYLIDPKVAASTAYAYKYWQDKDSIWMDATVSAGGRSVQAGRDALKAAQDAGQRTDADSLQTCVWDTDSDPNTPMHTEKCFMFDEERNIVLVIWTETQTVGDPNGARLAQQVWNGMTLN